MVELVTLSLRNVFRFRMGDFTPNALMAIFYESKLHLVFLALLKLKDKSDESGESVDGYIDMVFDLFFDEEEDDSSEEDTDLAFGPEFDPSQFFALLNNDIDKAYERKCKKISGSDDTYNKIKAASKELGQCLKTFVKSEEIRAAYTKLDTEEDLHTLIKT